jgi:hypothetical protein
MIRTIAILLVLFGCGAIGVARAEKAIDCKICRDQHRACVQAHSQAACKTELSFCLKQCKQR